jgi:hypothetical protein
MSLELSLKQVAVIAPAAPEDALVGDFVHAKLVLFQRHDAEEVFRADVADRGSLFCVSSHVEGQRLLVLHVDSAQVALEKKGVVMSLAKVVVEVLVLVETATAVDLWVLFWF